MVDKLQEVAWIMGVDESTVPILPKIKNFINDMKGYDEKRTFFEALNLTKDKTVLDIPCGQGGLSVYLAKNYNVSVEGYDILPGFIENANEFATEHNVANRCHFSVEDIRNVINKGKEYDVLLWFNPPHIWADYKQTIEHLRKCVKHNGYILINDAYIYDEHKNVTPDYETFETLEETKESVTAHGDTIIEFVDYKDSLWASGYQEDREAVQSAMKGVRNPDEIKEFEKLLKDIDKNEQIDARVLGIYFLVLQVAK